VADYSKDWERYRRLSKLVVVGIVGAVPWLLIVGRIPASSYLAQYAKSAVILAWWVGLMVVLRKLTRFRCPRCGKGFSKRWWYPLGRFAGKCVHCSLPKYSNG
jgi:hypothetical protein